MIQSFQKGKYPPLFSPMLDSFKRIKKHNEKILFNKKSSRSANRCGLGTGMGSIGYDGSIYGCQEQDSLGHDSFFYLGNIYDGIDIEKHKQFLQEYVDVEKVTCAEKPDYCNNCPLASLCGELNCPSSSQDLYHSFAKDSYVHCFWLRTMYEQAIVILKYLDENPTFRNYLRDFCGYDFLSKEDEANGM